MLFIYMKMQTFFSGTGFAGICGTELPELLAQFSPESVAQILRSIQFMLPND